MDTHSQNHEHQPQRRASQRKSQRKLAPYQYAPSATTTKNPVTSLVALGLGSISAGMSAAQVAQSADFMSTQSVSTHGNRVFRPAKKVSSLTTEYASIYAVVDLAPVSMYL